MLVASPHRVSIEGKSPYKESYTVNSLRKMFPQYLTTCLVMMAHALGCWKSDIVHSFSKL